MKTLIMIPVMAIFLGFALLIGAVLNAQAGHHGYSMFSPNISEMDNNNDGVVSFEEYSAYHSEKLRWSFNAIDADNDGSISAGEWDTFLKMHGVGKNYGEKHQG